LTVIVHRRLGRLLAGVHDHELAHHPVVLVPHEMAMEHVRDGGIGVPGEAKQQVCGGARRDSDVPNDEYDDEPEAEESEPDRADDSQWFAGE
jgi:hypothetical protein